MTVDFSNYTDENGQNHVTALLCGEIDHHSAIHFREKIDTVVRGVKPKTLTLDFSGITFMDSSGVGLVIGRYKIMSFFGGTVILRNVADRYERILRLSGIEKIATFEVRGEAV